jgi:hypothetical protein
MSTFSNWTPSELDYLLSLDTSELQSTLEGLPEEDRSALMQSLLNRVEELKRDEFISDKETLAQRLNPPISGTMLDRYVKRGMRLEGPPYSLLASQAEYDRVRKETGVDERGTDAELRRERLRADIAEKLQNVRSKQIKNDQAERRLVPLELALQFIRMAFEEVRREIETIPDAAQKSVPAEFRPQVYQEARAVVASVMKRLAAKRIDPEGLTENP